MALSPEDRKETIEIFTEAFVNGLSKFRSDTEEAAAKAKLEEKKPEKPEGAPNDSGPGTGFSLAGFVLGQR